MIIQSAINIVSQIYFMLWICFERRFPATFNNKKSLNPHLRQLYEIFQSALCHFIYNQIWITLKLHYRLPLLQPSLLYASKAFLIVCKLSIASLPWQLFWTIAKRLLVLPNKPSIQLKRLRLFHFFPPPHKWANYYLLYNMRIHSMNRWIDLPT